MTVYRDDCSRSLFAMIVYYDCSRRLFHITPSDSSRYLLLFVTKSHLPTKLGKSPVKGKVRSA